MRFWKRQPGVDDGLDLRDGSGQKSHVVDWRVRFRDWRASVLHGIFGTLLRREDPEFRATIADRLRSAWTVLRSVLATPRNPDQASNLTLRDRLREMGRRWASVLKAPRPLDGSPLLFREHLEIFLHVSRGTLIQRRERVDPDDVLPLPDRLRILRHRLATGFRHRPGEQLASLTLGQHWQDFWDSVAYALIGREDVSLASPGDRLRQAGATLAGAVLDGPAISREGGDYYDQLAGHARARRLAVLVLGVLMVGGALLVVRHHTRQLRLQRIADLRLSATRAEADGLVFAALDSLQGLLREGVADDDVLRAFIRVRPRVPMTGGRHLLETAVSLQVLCDRYPDDEALVSQLLDLNEALGRNVELVQLCDYRLDRDPSRIDHRRRRARALYRMRRFEASLADWDIVVKAFPLDAEANLSRFDAMVQTGSSPVILVEQAQQLREKHPDEPLFELILSLALRQGARMVESAEWLTRAANHAITDARTLLSVALALDSEGRFGEASQLINRSAQSMPSAELRLLVVRRRWEASDWPGVVQASRVEPDSDDRELLLRGLSQIMLGQDSEARTLAKTLLTRQASMVSESAGRFLEQLLPEARKDLSPDFVRQVGAMLPDFPYILFYVGEAQEAIGEKELALASWRAAAQRAPFWTLPWCRMARVAAERGHLDEAIEASQQAFARPDSHLVLSDLAEVWNELLDRGDARPNVDFIEAARRVEALDPLAVVTGPTRVRLLLAAGREDQAAKLLRQLATREMKPDRRVMLKLCELSRRLSADVEAVCFDRFVREFGMDAEAGETKAQGMRARGQGEAALAWLGQQVKAAASADQPGWELARLRVMEAMSHPGTRAQWLGTVDLYPEHRDLQRAALASPVLAGEKDVRRRAIDRLKAQTGSSAGIWRLELARWYLDFGSPGDDLGLAVPILRQLVAESPTLWEAHATLARIYERLGSIQSSAEQMAIASALQPYSVDLLLEAVESLQKSGDWIQAREQLRRANRVLPMAPPQRRRAARLLLAQGDLDEARAVLQLAWTKGPPQPSDELLGRLLILEGKIEPAREVAAALAAIPCVEGMLLMRDIAQLQGDREQAEQWMGRIEAASPRAQGLWQRALWHLSLGRRLEADKALGDAVEADPAFAPAWRQRVSLLLGLGRAADAYLLLGRAPEAIRQQPWSVKLEELKDLVSTISGEDRRRAVVARLVAEGIERSGGELLSTLLGDPESIRAPATMTDISRREGASKWVRLYAANHLLVIGMPEEAQASLRQLEHIYPMEASLFDLGARCAAASGDWVETIGWALKWRRRVGVGRTDAEAILAMARMRVGRSREVADELESRLPLILANPAGNVRLLEHYARATIRGGRPGRALDLLMPEAIKSPAVARVLIRLVPDIAPSPDIGRDRAMAILDQLAPQGGSHGPELEADVSFAMDDLAATLKDKDLAARAGARMRALLDKGSSSMTPGQRFLLCEAARRLGDAPAARKWLETVVADDPENGAARNNLAVLLLESDANPARALALARQASWLDPGNPLRMETLAVALYHSGSHEEGIRLLRRCVDLDPKRVIWAINLARWLGDAGRFAEAKLQLERARTYSGDMAKLIDTQLDLMHRGTLVPTSRPTVGP